MKDKKVKVDKQYVDMIKKLKKLDNPTALEKTTFFKKINGLIRKYRKKEADNDLVPTDVLTRSVLSIIEDHAKPTFMGKVSDVILLFAFYLIEFSFKVKYFNTVMPKAIMHSLITKSLVLMYNDGGYNVTIRQPQVFEEFNEYITFNLLRAYNARKYKKLYESLVAQLREDLQSLTSLYADFEGLTGEEADLVKFGVQRMINLQEQKTRIFTDKTNNSLKTMFYDYEKDKNYIKEYRHYVADFINETEDKLAKLKSYNIDNAISNLEKETQKLVTEFETIIKNENKEEENVNQ